MWTSSGWRWASCLPPMPSCSRAICQQLRRMRAVAATPGCILQPQAWLHCWLEHPCLHTVEAALSHGTLLDTAADPATSCVPVLCHATVPALTPHTLGSAAVHHPPLAVALRGPGAVSTRHPGHDRHAGHGRGRPRRCGSTCTLHTPPAAHAASNPSASSNRRRQQHRL
jgi:hypothetical protein